MGFVEGVPGSFPAPDSCYNYLLLVVSPRTLSFLSLACRTDSPKVIALIFSNKERCRCFHRMMSVFLERFQVLEFQEQIVP